jgi:AcrR family transcriptional regulator
MLAVGNMSATSTPQTTLKPRPMRADARRNYDKVLAAAREAFAEGGSATSLEEIARRAGVGIGTLYRHFPSRQQLLEAAYVDEVEAFASSTAELQQLPPWEAVVGWVNRFQRYVVTKQALAGELLEYMDHGAALFGVCRKALHDSGRPIVERAQAAHVLREDVTVEEIFQIMLGIAKIPTSEPSQRDRFVAIALDGLRYRPA